MFRGVSKQSAQANRHRWTQGATFFQQPYLDEGRDGVGESIPYPDASFDLVFADNVLDHLPDPARVFAEVARVLRGGRLSREDAEQVALCATDRAADAPWVSPLGRALAGTGGG